MLEVRLLGQFDVRLDGQPVEIPSRPAQSLLAYLMLHAGRFQRREKLAGLLWPEASERNARSNLRHALWRLRKAVGENHFRADKISIAFDPQSPHWFDVAVLEACDPQQGLEAAMQAISVYGGDLLPGFYDDWVVLERERLRAVFERAMQGLLQELLNAGRYDQVLRWSERWIALGQISEPAYRAQMVAQAAMGDLAGMATTYQRCCKALRQELGVDPSPETEETYRWLAAGGGARVRAGQKARLMGGEDAGQAIRAMLRQRIEDGKGPLDLASLAIVHAGPAELRFDLQETTLLVQSALEQGVDVEPWIGRAASPTVAVGALKAAWKAYPRPKVRQRIVEALVAIEGREAQELLLTIATTEEMAPVRSMAAVAVARRGNLAEVARALAKQAQEGANSAAQAALVAVADEVGLPADLPPYPRLPVALALALRRWGAMRGLVLTQVIRAGLGAGLISAFHGLFSPFYQLLSPATVNDYYETLQLVSLPAWMISGALGFLLLGGTQGAASGFAIGLADTLWRNRDRQRWRLLLGALAGLVHAGWLILATSIANFPPAAPPALYIPTYLLYGLALGSVLVLAIPPLDAPREGRAQLKRALLAALLGVIISLPYGLLDVSAAIGNFPRRLVFAVVLPLGIALALRKPIEPLDLRGSAEQMAGL